jgi:glycine cleavage system H lipoate-binding protein
VSSTFLKRGIQSVSFVERKEKGKEIEKGKTILNSEKWKKKTKETQ